MSVWAEVFDSQNINWLVVLIVGTAATLLGTVITNGVTVERAHNEIRLASEALANQHLTYVAFFPALIAALDLKEPYKNACFASIFVSFTLFVIGLLNIRKHDNIIDKDHSCSHAENCDKELNANSRQKIVRLNALLAAVSLAFSLVLVFSLQFGKAHPEHGPIQPQATVGTHLQAGCSKANSSRLSRPV